MNSSTYAPERYLTELSAENMYFSAGKSSAYQQRRAIGPSEQGEEQKRHPHLSQFDQLGVSNQQTQEDTAAYYLRRPHQCEIQD